MHASLQLEALSVEERVDHHVVDVPPAAAAAVAGRVAQLGRGGRRAVDGAARHDVAQRQVVDVALGPQRAVGAAH